GTFQSAQAFAAGANPFRLLVSDVDGDGFDDILVANRNGMSVLRGNGDCTFRALQNFPTGDSFRSEVLGDVNGDGFDDVVVAKSGKIGVLRGNGDGTFQAAQDFAIPVSPYAVLLGDVDGDGSADLVTANYDNTVTVFRGNGDGTFHALTSYFSVGRRPIVAALGDINNDGIDDIVTVNVINSDVSVLRGTQPQLLAISPTSGEVQSIPIRGRPLLLTSVGEDLYWMTAEPKAGSFGIWTYSPIGGVRKVTSVTMSSTTDQPIRLVATASTLVVESNSMSGVFDRLTGNPIKSNISDGTFQTPQSYNVGDHPISVVLGDVNGDGFDDIVTANSYGDDVSVLRGNGDGTFRTSENFATGDSPQSVVLSDVNGDGFDDIITANNRYSGNVSVLRGNGDGTFQAAQNVATGGTPWFAIVGDVNGDGFKDIITANYGSDNVSVLRGVGDGTFQAAQIFSAGDGPVYVALGDVNGDGFDDIVTGNRNADSVSVLRGNGDGTFQAKQNLAVGEASRYVTLGDVDGDGLTDIVTGNVSVLRGNGDGTFRTAQHVASGSGPFVLADVNDDGLPDILAPLKVFRNNGDQTFQPALGLANGFNGNSFVFRDVNRDGIDDIVTVSFNSNTVNVLVGKRSVVDVIDLPYAAVLVNRAGLQVRQSELSELQSLLIEQPDSAIGPLQRLRDYEFVALTVFEDNLLATVRLTDTTTRPGELQLLLIDAPQFDQNGKLLSSAVENLTLNSSLRLSGGESRQLFVNGDRIYLTAEIAGSGIGDELLVYDRASGLRLVGDLLPGSQSSEIRDFVAVGDNVYFTALASRIDNSTHQSVLHRELFVLNPSDNSVRAVRAGQEVTGPPSLVGTTLFFNSQLADGSSNLLWSYDTAQDGIPSLGALDPVTGTISGAVYLDRNGDGRRDVDEPGRSGVTIYVDINGNGRREASEPFAVSRLDDPATVEDEAGRYTFNDLPAGNYQLRELLAAGFDQTAPLTLQSGAPMLTELASGTTSGAASSLGLPSIVGGDVVYVNLASGSLVLQDGDNGQIPLVSLQSVLPDDATAIQSVGSSHAQDGNRIVLTVTLVDGREIVLTTDAAGRLSIVADTGSPLITPLVQPTGTTTLTDVEDASNHGFDSLGIADGAVGFLATKSTGPRGTSSDYYLGSGTAFATFQHAQVILSGGDEIFVDRVLDGSPQTVITGANLFLDKATLDAQLGGNTGWTITTRAGEVILPLTFFDRIYDVAVSGTSVVFRASDSSFSDAIYLATADGGVTLLARYNSHVPDSVRDRFTQFGSLASNADSPSVSLDGNTVVFVARIGNSSAQPMGLYAWIDGSLRVIADSDSDFGGRTLTDLSIGHQAISGNQVVFRATFGDGTESIYRAVLPSDPVFEVTVQPGETVTDVSFGASAVPGTIRGTSFTDTNLDGLFNSGEPVNAGRVVFLDENLNGSLDDSEVSTVTDSNGEFAFFNLSSETTYVVREVLPDGLSATTRQTLAKATVRLGAAGTVETLFGSVATAALGESADGEVTGVIFNDVNGNGKQDDVQQEPGIAGVTVFVDENGDGKLNGGERSTITGVDGSYTINQLQGVPQEVRVVLPNDHSYQTNALGNSFRTQKLQTSDTPAGAAIVNLNDDDFPDLVVSVLNVGELRTFLNDGQGNFVESDPLRIGGSPDVVVPLRLNGEASPSAVIVAHPNLQRVDVVKPGVDPGNGSGFSVVSLVKAEDLSAGGILAGFAGTPFIARGIVTGDFNGDLIDDIAIAVERGPTGSGGGVVIFTGNGQGGFVFEQTLFINRNNADGVLGIAAGRFTDNGPVDLVVTGFSSNTAVVLRNSGNAGADANRFTLDRTLQTGERGTSSVQIADVDRDGNGDIVVANSLSGSVSLFAGNADGSFEPARQFSAGTFPTSLQVLDLDGDNQPEILFTVVAGTDRIGILRNLGNIGPGNRVEFQALETSGVAVLPDGTTAFSMAVGQLDSNRTPDVVVTLRRDPGIQINARNVLAGLNTINIALNTVVPGGLNVELPVYTRKASGQNFGLQTINLPPTIASVSDPVAINEDADQQTVVLTGISTGGEVETLHVSVSVTSDNTSLISPTITFDAVAGTATVRYTPGSNLSGTAKITVTVRDAGINGAFNDADANSDDGIATTSFNVVVRPVNDPPTAEADTFGVLLENGATTLDVLSNDNLANPDTGEPLTILFTGQPASGRVAIINGGQQLQYTPSAGFIGRETFSYIVSDNQFTNQGSVTVNVTSNVTPSELLTVSSFTPNPSGFDVTFSEAFNASLLNLYATQSLGPADVVVTGASSGVVNGSLVIDAAAGTASFIKTGGLLAADTYTVTLRSGSDGFVTTDGDLLDGNRNGTGGDNFTTVFTVTPLSPETVTVSIPDFTRGFGQAVNVPADGLGIPLTISRGTGISSLNLRLGYDSSLLDVTGFIPTVAGLLADFNVDTGALAISKPTEFTSETGPLTLGYFTASVPDTAIYTSKQVILISGLRVFDDSVSTTSVPSVADSAIHVAAFPGDANASRSYNSPDTTLTLRQSTVRIDGLTLYPLADPALISDVTFDSSILANDATVVQRLITNTEVPVIPDLPSGIDPLPARGADPILSIPRNLTARLGQTITLPIQLEVTEAAGITISGLDVAISYDANQFSVGNVRVGSLLTDNGLSPFSPFANTAT
ncbi:MAG: VCBS repeat-containing protein, partial [Rhodopirellula sp.]|nr:VCBS repeat-containing protein [Rhodopirellula sp.]